MSNLFQPLSRFFVHCLFFIVYFSMDDCLLCHRWRFRVFIMNSVYCGLSGSQKVNRYVIITTICIDWCANKKGGIDTTGTSVNVYLIRVMIEFVIGAPLVDKRSKEQIWYRRGCLFMLLTHLWQISLFPFYVTYCFKRTVLKKSRGWWSYEFWRLPVNLTHFTFVRAC